MAQLINGNEIVTPTAADAARAQESGRRLADHLRRTERPCLELHAGASSEPLDLPPPALQLLLHALTEMGRGHALALTPVHAELTTQQAADLLNVSRPHLVKLLDEKAMPSHKVGTHRRVLLTDLLAYKREFLAKRQAALDELVALGQELDMGY